MYLRKNRKNSAITLTEIILAMALVATAFIPIMGVMGTSIKATDKDNRTIKAVNLCQQKINQALQMPFGYLERNANPEVEYGTDIQETLQSTAGSKIIKLVVGPEEIDGIQFKFVLKVKDRPGSFTVPMYDPAAKAANKDDPKAWDWNIREISYSEMCYQYTMTVFWKDKGSNRQKRYSLASFKSRVRE
ncbi:MAG: hypothetical protein ACQETH_03530 [Candidatus Rifleibacteriota bacterium]